jgi:hypothetical protein
VFKAFFYQFPISGIMKITLTLQNATNHAKFMPLMLHNCTWTPKTPLSSGRHSVFFNTSPHRTRALGGFWNNPSSINCRELILCCLRKPCFSLVFVTIFRPVIVVRICEKEQHRASYFKLQVCYDVLPHSHQGHHIHTACNNCKFLL